MKHILHWTGLSLLCVLFSAGVANAQQVGQSPLYRYYNTRNADHFYTANFAELGSGGGEWVFEGAVGYVYTQPRPGTVPFYRYFNTRSGDHFYTVDYAELGAGGANGWVAEGIAAYVYPPNGAGSGRGPLYRFFNADKGDHLYTPNRSELACTGGWVFEGVAAYVDSPPPSTQVVCTRPTPPCPYGTLPLPTGGCVDRVCWFDPYWGQQCI